MRRRVLFLILTTVVATVSTAVADPCDQDVTRTVMESLGKWSRSGKFGRVLIARRSNGEVRPQLVDWTNTHRSALMAEELVADSRARNGRAVEISEETARPFALINLADYSRPDGIDWARVDADYPGAQTIVELSRPGCDTLKAFGILRRRYYFRTKRDVPDSVLFHLSKEPAKSWHVDLMEVWEH